MRAAIFALLAASVGCGIEPDCHSACASLGPCPASPFADEGACVATCVVAQSHVSDARSFLGCYEDAGCDLDAVARCGRREAAAAWR